MGIDQCANNPESLQMLKQAGEETRAAHPQQVPWVVFENQEGYNIQSEMVVDVCNQEQQDGLGQPACCTNAASALYGAPGAWPPSARVRAAAGTRSAIDEVLHRCSAFPTATPITA